MDEQRKKPCTNASKTVESPGIGLRLCGTVSAGLLELQSRKRVASMKREKIRSSKDRVRREAAEALAVSALAFLASEPEHLGGFLAATGVGPTDIRAAARDPDFLVGVLDHFSSNEPLLVAFATDQGIDPMEIERARAALGAVWERDMP
jgi:hypothetical protein